MVAIKSHIWLHDYVWTLVTKCLSHKNHIALQLDFKNHSSTIMLHYIFQNATSM